MRITMIGGAEIEAVVLDLTAGPVIGTVGMISGESGVGAAIGTVTSGRGTGVVIGIGGMSGGVSGGGGIDVLGWFKRGREFVLVLYLWVIWGYGKTFEDIRLRYRMIWGIKPWACNPFVPPKGPL
jgi:hypothetical protein